MTTSGSRSSEIHSTLDHPVIDSDGHSMDFMPLLEDYLAEFGGQRAVDRYRTINQWFDLDDLEREQGHVARPSWWDYPTKNGVDYATSLLPGLLEERLGEFGLDFCVIYPSPLRVGVPHLDDDELRQPLCRALNAYQADLYGPFAHCMTPAAVIPMHTPTEAIEELDYAVKVLGMKTTSLASFVQRTTSTGRTWWDNLALDSAYDYDPVWAKCVELHVPPGFHSGTMGLASRTSYSNFVYNHIGHFGAGCEPICKALFLGGVTRRFPELQFIFLESGVGWAATLYADLVGHWKKRNTVALQNYDPSTLDLDLMRDLFRKYGSARFVDKLDRISEVHDRLSPIRQSDFERHFDEFAALDIDQPSDVRDRFVQNFFFGCEGDDPMNPIAFKGGLLPYDARLKAVYGSDIGHWDVPDMSEVLEEAYELVEDGSITTGNFREFVFANPVKLFTGMNPDFFAGTTVADAVVAELQNF